ncbi:hypothetical protein CAPTEDRAFT_193621 [Capitella teleta]|uniref:G-protein coupled receptors family 1 profile domain-containing protein n=1 Tax=Capitella teleta TaxID=283909 RepID=R7VAU3_CAPTE|nr:hypothetical protein CAPTEDRAFT_193621 [Capitella teleta]|eukprot:ELU15968.1 hypothetical protein CAPTEDRAFT_193621 [Capitella teleta]
MVCSAICISASNIATEFQLVLHAVSAILSMLMDGLPVTMTTTAADMDKAADATTFQADTLMHSGPFEAWKIAAFALFIPINVLAMTGNILTIAAFFKFQNLQDATNCLICSQSFADVGSAAVSWIYVFITYIPAGNSYITTHKYACLIYLWTSCAYLTASSFSITGISIERSIAVILPFVNMKRGKKRFTLWSITLSWVFIIMLTSLPTLGLNRWAAGTQCNVYLVYAYPVLSYSIIFPMFVILGITAFLNAGIGLHVLKRQLQRSKKIKPRSDQHEASTSVGSIDTTTTRRVPQSMKSSNRRLTRMLLMVVGTFYMCWLPYLSITWFSFSKPFMYVSMPNLIITHEFTKFILLLSGALNPLIYAQKNAHFKKAFKHLLGRQ